MRLTRAEAEKLISEWQLRRLEESGLDSICEFYVLHGLGPDCSKSPFCRTDTELRELYNGRVPNIDRLPGGILIRAIMDYERSVSGSERLTCAKMAHSRLCEGLDCLDNLSLSLMLLDVLNEWYEVAD